MLLFEQAGSVVKRLGKVFLEVNIMIIKVGTSFLALIILSLGLGLPIMASVPDAKTDRHAENVRVKLARLGTGKEARVEIKLRDKTKLKGYIQQLGPETFTVIDDRNGVQTEVAYGNAKQVRGNNLSTGAKVAIAVGIILGIATIAVLCCS